MPNETLKEVASKAAIEIVGEMRRTWAPHTHWEERITDAIIAGMRAALAEPTEAMKRAGSKTYMNSYDFSHRCWEVMAAERLKEVE